MGGIVLAIFLDFDSGQKCLEQDPLTGMARTMVATVTARRTATTTATTMAMAGSTFEVGYGFNF